MNAKLLALVAKIDDAAKNLKPWPAANVREAAIMEGLQIMLSESNPDAELKPSRINARGEFEVFAYPIGRDQGFCAQYGEKFAAALSKVAWRCGVNPVSVGIPMLPQNGWCYVNHFDAEHIVRMAAAAPEAGDIVHAAAGNYVRFYPAASNASGRDEFNAFGPGSVRIGPAKGYSSLQAAIEGISRNDPREPL